MRTTAVILTVLAMLVIAPLASAAKFLPNEGGPLNTGTCTWRNVGAAYTSAGGYQIRCMPSGYWVMQSSYHGYPVVGN